MEHGKTEFESKSGRRALSLIFSLLLITVIAALGVACGLSEPAGNAGKNSQTQKATGVNQNDRNSPEVAAVNTESTNGDSVNATSQSATDRTMQRIERLRAEAANKTSSSNAGQVSRPAPEDSTITSQLADVARETRTFKKHRVLLRVEKVNDGKNSALRIFLRDGRTFDRPGTAIPNLSTITAAEILQIAGVGGPATNLGDSPKKKPSS